MCKKAVKKIFGGGGGSKPKVVIQQAPTPAPSAVSVNAPSSNPEGSMGFQENEENTFKRKGKNALKINKKNPSMQGLQI